MKEAGKFEIHYYLENNSHSMDALVRNKCEAELLSIAHEIISQFDLGITIEAEAWKEGGLRNWWKTLSNTDKIALAGVFTALLGVVLSQIPTSDSVKDTENCLNIEKLKAELLQEVISREVIDDCAKLIQKKPKIAVHKSNFYRKLNHYSKVTKVGFVALDKENKPLKNEDIVIREDFPKFILLSNKLDTEIIEGAQIEIIAPVLKEGNAKWKGLYIEPTPISFEMKDQSFKKAVLNKQVSFKTGDSILCVLEVHRELNEVGEIIITNYIVRVVLEKIDNGERKETESGKKYRREIELKRAQLNLNLI